MARLKNKYKNFSQLPNDLIVDSSLPDKEYRIITYLFSRPDNWKVNNADIMRKFNIKTRDTMAKYWKLILASGWVTREKEKIPSGKFAGFDYEMHFEPCRDETDTVSNRVGGVRTLNNTDDINNTDNKNNTEFVPPTNEEVLDYLKSKNISEIESKNIAFKFFNHYNNNDWMVGKKPNQAKMSKWKLAVTNWLKNIKSFKNNPKPPKKDPNEGKVWMDGGWMENDENDIDGLGGL